MLDDVRDGVPAAERVQASCNTRSCDFFARVLHEPLGEPYYYGPQRMSKRFNAENSAVLLEQYRELSFNAEWQNIVGECPDGKSRTFVKDMAHYVIPPHASTSITPPLPDFDNDGNPTVIPSHSLLHPDVHHAFLVRSPSKAVPSYYRLCIPPKSETTGFHYFDPEEVGLKESKLLYDWLVKQGKDPLVVDAQDLLENPSKVMSQFCADAGVDFNESMCNWEGGEVVEHFKKWAGFHDDAEKSSGIGKRAADTPTKATGTETPTTPSSAMPDAVRDAISSNLETYEYLSSKVREQQSSLA